ncbi:MAG: hypothetical protein ACI90V_001699 [Bacillariaceae sp.]|jgi:hypothetical protein
MIYNYHFIIYSPMFYLIIFIHFILLFFVTTTFIFLLMRYNFFSPVHQYDLDLLIWNFLILT